MSQINNLKDACANGFSSLHRLSCGHIIETPGSTAFTVVCQANCAKSQHNGATKPQTGIFFLCEQCIEDNAMARIVAGAEDHFLLLSTLHIYRDADEKEKHRLRLELVNQINLAGRLRVLTIEGSSEGLQKGGVVCHKADVNKMVNDLVDAFGSADIDSTKQDTRKAADKMHEMLAKLGLGGEGGTDEGDVGNVSKIDTSMAGLKMA